MAGETAVAEAILSRRVAAVTLSPPVVAATMADLVAVARPARAVRDTGTKTAARHWR